MTSVPKHLKNIEINLTEKLQRIKKPDSELLETQQLHYDEVLEIYQEAFKNLIDGTTTYSKILEKIKQAYEHAIQIRDERISQFITQDVNESGGGGPPPLSLISVSMEMKFVASDPPPPPLRRPPLQP